MKTKSEENEESDMNDNSYQYKGNEDIKINKKSKLINSNISIKQNQIK